jgi:hypothetical protein
MLPNSACRNYTTSGISRSSLTNKLLALSTTLGLPRTIEKSKIHPTLRGAGGI